MSATKRTARMLNAIEAELFDSRNPDHRTQVMLGVLFSDRRQDKKGQDHA